MKNRIALAGLLALLLAGCSGGGSVPPPSTPDYFSELNLSLRWSTTKTAAPLKVFIGQDGSTDRSVEVMAAISAWPTATSNLVRFTQVATTGEADITVSFADTVDSADGGIGLAAVSFAIVPGNPTADGIIQSGTVTLKRGISTSLLTPTVQHEIGHTLGIVGRNKGDNGHSAYSGDVMHDIIGTSSKVSSRDAATLVKLYAISRTH
jgi:predicted Zn-dependent protease